MADFQYTAAAGHEGEHPEVDGPYGKERAPLTVPPPLFSKQDEPLDYAFRWQPPAPPSGAEQHLVFLAIHGCVHSRPQVASFGEDALLCVSFTGFSNCE